MWPPGRRLLDATGEEDREEVITGLGVRGRSHIINH